MTNTTKSKPLAPSARESVTYLVCGERVRVPYVGLHPTQPEWRIIVWAGRFMAVSVRDLC